MIRSVVLILTLWVATLFGQTQKRHEEMLYPIVRVTLGKTGGSGTVVYCDKDETGRYHTFVLTNYHVISGAISVEQEWDAEIGEDVKKERRKLCYVEFFYYNPDDTPAGGNRLDAEIVAYEAKPDWALLRLRATFKPPGIYVAHLYPGKEVERIRMFDDVYAVGATLGHAPIATKGTITHKGDIIDHFEFWLSSACISYGNSGGAVFRYSKERKRYEYIGIPSRVAVVGWSTPISHMGYFIPIPRVYKMLKTHCFDFIYDKNKSMKQCDKEREEKRRRARERFIKRRGKVEPKKDVGADK